MNVKGNVLKVKYIKKVLKITICDTDEGKLQHKIWNKIVFVGKLARYVNKVFTFLNSEVIRFLEEYR